MRVSPRLLIASLASCGLAAGHVYITDLVAEDPDESGEDFDESDTLSVLFSEPTSEPFGSSGLAKSDVDALLDFSSEVRGDYWAFWNTSSLLVVHFGVVEAESAPVPGEFQVRCRAAATAAILPRGASSGGCEGSSPPLRGAWGYTRPSLVEISSVVAYDPDDGDEVCACAGGSAGGGSPSDSPSTQLSHPHAGPRQVFSAGDVLTLRFSTPTNRAGRDPEAGELSPEEVEALLAWSPHPTGAAFVANWSDDSAGLTLRVTEAGESRPAPTNSDHLNPPHDQACRPCCRRPCSWLRASHAYPPSHPCHCHAAPQARHRCSWARVSWPCVAPPHCATPRCEASSRPLSRPPFVASGARPRG